MSDKVYQLYIKQIDKYHMVCNSEEFAQKTLSLCNSGLVDPHLTPSEYIRMCRYRAQQVIAHG